MTSANATITGRLFAKYADEAKWGIDFETFVQDRRKSGLWPEFELALSVKDRIPDARIEDVLRDMQAVQEPVADAHDAKPRGGSK